VGLYAFYFFGRAAAVGHVAFVAGLYAATLVHEPPSSPVARWLTTVATLIVAGVLIDALACHARRETDVAAKSAQSMVRVTNLAHELAGLSDRHHGPPRLVRGGRPVERHLGKRHRRRILCRSTCRRDESVQHRHRRVSGA